VFSSLGTAKALVFIPDCNYYNQNYINGNTFLNYEKVDYQNGLLVFHFTFDPQSTSRTITAKFRLQEPDQCSSLNEEESAERVALPGHLDKFSIRFIAENSYQFFDDESGTPLDCRGCKQDFGLPVSHPGPYKAQFELSAEDKSSSFFSTSQLIKSATSIVRTPLLIIPGLMGTEIYKGSELLWPNWKRAILDYNDDFLSPLGFNSKLEPKDKTLTVGKVIRKIDLLNDSLPIYDYTDSLIQDLAAKGYRENVDLFLFPYDWRLSVEQLVPLLKHRIQYIIDQTKAAKINLLAHSNGGLVAKKYIMDTTESHIDKVIFIGVPNVGAPKAAKILLGGDSLGLPGLSSDRIKELARNMPSIYGLLPSYGYVSKLGSYLGLSTLKNIISPELRYMDYAETKHFLLQDKQLNTEAYRIGESLHTYQFDNFDVRSKGVKAYNIIGCQTATIGQVIERKASPFLPLVNGYAIKYVPGDGTVPWGSTDHIPVDKQKDLYFVEQAAHDKMLSQAPARAQVLGILEDNYVSVDGIHRDADRCKLNGKVISVFSPVALEAVDNLGNRARLRPDGSIENAIPGVVYDAIGDHKFMFLPNNSSGYAINLIGTGRGNFTLEVDTISNNEYSGQSTYYNVPVTPKSRGQLNLGGDTQLLFDGKSYNPDVQNERGRIKLRYPIGKLLDLIKRLIR
jgi:pimeloyl-ACP methyl ester carboxylesterase